MVELALVLLPLLAIVFGIIVFSLAVLNSNGCYYRSDETKMRQDVLKMPASDYYGGATTGYLSGILALQGSLPPAPAAGAPLTPYRYGGKVEVGPERSYIAAMLRLSKKADYGLIALMHLALAGEGRSASAKEIADAHSLPLPLLAKVLQKLTKEGFLAAAQGTNGGYRLARLPDSISALEVIRAIDGPVFLTSCSTTGSDCYKTSKCTAREPLERIREDIFHLLAGITLTEMSSGGRSEPPLVTLKAAGDII